MKLKNIKQKLKINLASFYTNLALLKDSKRNWNGKELAEVENILNQAKNIVIQDVENHLLRKENKDYYYLEMREDQLKILKKC